MNDHFTLYRRCLFVGVAIFVMIALVIAAVVIPPVKADTFPLATPERAVPAFWVSFVLHLLLATVLFFTALRMTETSGGRTAVLVSLGVIALVLSLPLADAADAYQQHGPPLQTASTSLFVCMAGGFLNAVLLITMAFLLRRRARMLITSRPG